MRDDVAGGPVARAALSVGAVTDRCGVHRDGDNVAVLADIYGRPNTKLVVIAVSAHLHSMETNSSMILTKYLEVHCRCKRPKLKEREDVKESIPVDVTTISQDHNYYTHDYRAYDDIDAELPTKSIQELEREIARLEGELGRMKVRPSKMSVQDIIGDKDKVKSSTGVEPLTPGVLE
ncbi:hypothetical protein DPMN_042937 [Dreissena polymorpha]|uniref:Uncharacterized protein n=1 Tax=Dreissena polymorpha TaxID=45954 RepID=A0A9D4HXC6_DREPO|nr:hypothetical protein DPMN_042937 [Dreissena polymorpha]